MWSAVLEKGTKYNQENDSTYCITQAALEHAESKKGYVQVFMDYEDKNTLLCTLKHNDILQVPLNLTVAEESDVKFYIKGDGKVHLSGFIDVGPYDGLDEEMDEDESDVSSLDDEEIVTALKRKADGKNQPDAKKAKVVNGGAAKPAAGKPVNGAAIKAEAEESDEDDDDDDDDDESDDDMNEADLQQLMKSIKAQKQKEGGVTAADSEEDSDEDDEEEEDSDENDVKPDQNKLKEAMKQIKGTPKPQGGKNQQQNQQQKSAQKPNQQQQQKGKGQNNSPGNKFGGKNTPNQTPGKKVSFGQQNSGGRQNTPGNQNKGKQFQNKGKFSGNKQRN